MQMRKLLCTIWFQMVNPTAFGVVDGGDGDENVC